MKIYSYILLVLFCFLVSCKDDEAARLQANAKDAKKNEQIFASIDKAWNFNPQPMNPTVVTMIQNWSEWRLFMTELQQNRKVPLVLSSKKQEPCHKSNESEQ